MQAIIDSARRVTGREIPTRDASRRAGDPARLIADSTNAKKALGWKPRYAEIESIIGHAWQWESRSLPEAKRRQSGSAKTV